MFKTEHIGRFVLGTVDYGKGALDLLAYCVAHPNAVAVVPIRAVFYKQIYFTGIEALGAIGFIAALSGIVVVTQVVSLIGADPTLIAKITLWTIVRELGPLLSAIVIIARSSSAVAAELATMKIRGELGHLKVMGIDPLDYLVIPRILGIAVSAVTVTAYFQFIAIVAGFAFVAVVYGVSFIKNIGGIALILNLTEVGASLAKAALFGLMIAATSCYYGLRARPTITAVPRAATHAVMSNLLTVFLLDGILTYLFFL